MHKQYKPGERLMEFQAKKKKHEQHMKKRKSYSESDSGSMKGYDPNLGLGAKSYTKTVTPKAAPSHILGSPKASTMKMAKQKHSKHEKHKKMCKMHKVEHTRSHHEKHHKHEKKLPSLTTKHTGKFEGKSNALGHGGRAAQLKARGVPGGVIGMMARRAHAAPGQANYHGKKHHKHKKSMHCKTCSC